MIIKKGSHAQLYESLVETLQAGPPEEHEFTAKDLARDSGCSDCTARRELQKLLEAGKVSARKACVNGNIAMAYTLIDADEQAQPDPELSDS